MSLRQQACFRAWSRGSALQRRAWSILGNAVRVHTARNGTQQPYRERTFD
jgi:hypothetical protein